jgi:hypothetical protein
MLRLTYLHKQASLSLIVQNGNTLQVEVTQITVAKRQLLLARFLVIAPNPFMQCIRNSGIVVANKIHVCLILG